MCLDPSEVCVGRAAEACTLPGARCLPAGSDCATTPGGVPPMMVAVTTPTMWPASPKRG